jgi:DNA-directed RNA polymerase specialized sigma24 family protein/ribosome-associated translation inhibitor RaiA
MNVHISYKAAKTPDVEKELNLHIAKTQKRLQVFRPELVHLHGDLEQNSTREGFVVSLNLRLPSGQMAAQSSAPTAVAAVKAAFADLTSQLTKHKEMLRVQQKQKRRLLRRSVREARLPAVPFEDTPAAVHPARISDSDVRNWVNANLARLECYVDRELRYREASGLLPPNLVTREEVIDEVIASALDDSEEKPELLSLERWLYRLAIRSIGRLAARNGEAIGTVPLETSRRKQNVQASDEPVLQYHQPDEMLTANDMIPDPRMSTPEEVAASMEMVNLVETALRNAAKEDREAFILYAIEGFTISEISVTTDRPPFEVQKSIEKARELVEKSVPADSMFKEKLLQHTRIA